jgi:hypothetical protein
VQTIQCRRGRGLEMNEVIEFPHLSIVQRTTLA